MIKSYKDNEFGSLMTTNFITIRHGLSIKKSIDHLIEEAKENDNIETIYIVNENNEFYGALTLRDLLITKKDEDLEEKIILSYPFVYDKEEITDAAIDTLADYSEDSIPVLNKESNEIIGIITSADIVELISKDEEEETAVSNEKEIKKSSYLEPLAFILILLVALNRIIGIVPSYFYVEIALIAVAVALEGYSYLSKNDLSLKSRS